MNPKLKSLLIRIAFYFALFLVIGIIVYVVIVNTVPELLPVLQNGNRDEIEAFIRDAGSGGIWIAALMQFLQVVSVIFPGAPVQLSCGIVFGAFKGFVIAHLSYVFANSLVFIMARRLGNKINAIAPMNMKKTKYQQLINADHPAFMVFITCLIPVIPNGCIPYLAANTDIKIKNFFFSVLFGSAPSILMFTAVGHRILTGDYNLAITYFVSYSVALIILLIFKNRLLEFILRKLNKMKLKRSVEN